MLDHVGLEVGDFERSKQFYERAFEPLGIRLMMEPVEGSAARPSTGLSRTSGSTPAGGRR
jgi:catechol 2,3-dioxygenase-like lactoylglutathione lyase family enzyme